MSMFISTVCMTSSGKFLVAKGGEKSIIPNLWSCGIFEAESNQMIEDSIRKFYLEQFNADVEIIVQNSGEVRRAIPISIFTVNVGDENNPKFINGVYFAAILRNPYQLQALQSYDDVKLYDIVEMVQNIGNVNIVPDLYYNLMVVEENFKTQDNMSFVDPTDKLINDIENVDNDNMSDIKDGTVDEEN